MMPSRMLIDVRLAGAPVPSTSEALTITRASPRTVGSSAGSAATPSVANTGATAISNSRIFTKGPLTRIPEEYSVADHTMEANGVQRACDLPVSAPPASSVDCELGADYSCTRGAGEIPALLPRPACECGLSCIRNPDDVHRLPRRVWPRRPVPRSRRPQAQRQPSVRTAGFIMPVEEVRGFGTWFFQRKCDLVDFEIQRSGEHAGVWEKKGSSLYTVTNVTRYMELRRTTFRMLNKIDRLGVGGRIFYYGIRKTADPATVVSEFRICPSPATHTQHRPRERCQRMQRIIGTDSVDLRSCPRWVRRRPVPNTGLAGSSPSQHFGRSTGRRSSPGSPSTSRAVC